MYQSAMFFPETPTQADNKNMMQNHCINPAANMEQINMVNLVRENFDLRERNNQLIKFNNQLMIEISQLKLEIEMMELKRALASEDR